MKQITESLYQISLGAANVFLLTGDDGLTLVDTGLPGSADKLFAAVRKGGKRPEDITRIVLTHWHPDHAGSAADLQQRLGARVVAHAADADILEQGGGERPRYLTPGLVNRLVFRFFINGVSSQIPPISIDERVADNALIATAGGLRVLHTPGHSAGHMALLLEQEGVLIAGDICANVFGLAYSTVYEDITLGQQSLLKVAAKPFDQAVFGHGGPVIRNASQKLREKFEQPLDVAGKLLQTV
ncbi:MBL fold metallo-hydrolase [Hymenobacter glaciei]|uniref:MBL fold metallo-hydrolase n=1 Tax=Hymenobacter glaciei TaxID=877209 RepID=A0ABP7U5P4_9BACT